MRNKLPKTTRGYTQADQIREVKQIMRGRTLLSESSDLKTEAVYLDYSCVQGPGTFRIEVKTDGSFSTRYL